jgi:hypothetical protein
MHLKERKKEKHDKNCIIRSFIVFIPRYKQGDQIKEEQMGMRYVACLGK